jgi:microcystin-dependent protein
MQDWTRHAHLGVDVDGTEPIASVATAENGSPVGAITMYGAAAAPTGWLLCDGSAVSRSTYAALYAVIGVTFGAGDASTTFNVPDMRGVFPKGAGTTSRAAGKDANGNYYAGTLGTYLTDKMQGHKHLVPNLTQYVSGRVGTAGAFSKNDGNINTEYTAVPSTDGTNGTPRTGLTTEPQSLCLSYIIKI